MRALVASRGFRYFRQIERLNGTRRVRPDLYLEELEEIGTGQTLVLGPRGGW